MTVSINDVKKIATAIAKINGHSHPHDWADKVAQEWKEPTEKADAIDESSAETDDEGSGA